MWSLCLQHFSERKDSILNGFRLSLKFCKEFVMVGDSPFHLSIMPPVKHGVNYIYSCHPVQLQAMVSQVMISSLLDPLL